MTSESTTDRILAIIDAGLQTTYEPAVVDNPDDPDLCVRCPALKADGGEYCADCRAYLLGDSDHDPADDGLGSTTLTERLGEAVGAPREMLASMPDGTTAHVIITRGHRPEALTVLAEEWGVSGATVAATASAMAGACRAALAAATETQEAEVLAQAACAPSAWPAVKAEAERRAAEIDAARLDPHLYPPSTLLAWRSVQDDLLDGTLPESSEEAAGSLDREVETARRGERRLLDRWRRSRRRTNRWGPRPDR